MRYFILVIMICLAPKQYSDVVSKGISDRANAYYRASRDVDGYAQIVRSGYTDFSPETEWLILKGA